MNFLEKILGRKTDDNGSESDDGLNTEKEKMIRGVVTLSQTIVKEVMVPRIDVVFLGVDMAGLDVFEKVVSCGHSRFPVYKDSIDNVVGVLYAKDLLRFLITNDEVKVDAIIRKPYFVPESKRLDSLLREMRRRRVHIAVAVDEYGGVSGIVCLEDIIEEIVGDIQDEFDNEQEELFDLGDGSYLADARLDIEDLNAKLGAQIPEEDFDTLGGFVFDLFGKIPSKYEKVRYDDIDFIIQEMDGHKIKTVKLTVVDNSVAQKEG
ncbi:MAG: hemolysin family protein [Spirochaetota bacterium]